jgi:hypothetical protein
MIRKRENREVGIGKDLPLSQVHELAVGDNVILEINGQAFPHSSTPFAAKPWKVSLNNKTEIRLIGLMDEEIFLYYKNVIDTPNDDPAVFKNCKDFVILQSTINAKKKHNTELEKEQFADSLVVLKQRPVKQFVIQKVNKFLNSLTPNGFKANSINRFALKSQVTIKTLLKMKNEFKINTIELAQICREIKRLVHCRQSTKR